MISCASNTKIALILMVHSLGIVVLGHFPTNALFTYRRLDIFYVPSLSISLCLSCLTKCVLSLILLVVALKSHHFIVCCYCCCCCVLFQDNRNTLARFIALIELETQEFLLVFIDVFANECIH